MYNLSGSRSLRPWIMPALVFAALAATTLLVPPAATVTSWPISADVAQAAERSPESSGNSGIFSRPNRPSRLSIPLPMTIRGWSRADTVRRVRPDALFDYMDGGAELYLAYRFRYLEVCEYTHPTEDAIVLELFFMETSNDAYGLLSLDWSGDAVLDRGEANRGNTVFDRGEVARGNDGDAVPAGIEAGSGIAGSPPRALYSGGLLRAWSGDLYLRIMAYKETEAAKTALLDLASEIVKGRPIPPLPDLLARFSVDSSAWHRPASRRATFFRTQVALNSICPLGPEDFLGLDESSEGAVQSFAVSGADSPELPCYLVAIRYPTVERATSGTRKFRRACLLEQQEARSDSDSSDGLKKAAGLVEKNGRRIFHVLSGRTLALAVGVRGEDPWLRQQAARLAHEIGGKPDRVE